MSVSRIAALAVLALIALLTFFPFVFMFITSFKNLNQFYHEFWLPMFPLTWSNYAIAWEVVSVYLVNSTYYSSVSIAGIALFASMAAFAFARYRFPGDQFLFLATISLLMIPSVLQLVPLFMEVRQFGLINTPWALILPWIAVSQPFSILVFRTFFANLPEEIFESAYMDGANKLHCYWLIGLPLSVPVVITILIVHLLATWNDFIWPLVAISSDSLRPVAVGLRFFQGTYLTQYGPMMAGFVIATLPLVVVFGIALRQFVSGLTAGALKG